jgi:hypothetical protein
MKLVVQSAPDQAELVLTDLDKDNFIVDQDTYCYFRDGVFIKGIENFVKKAAPGKWKEMENVEGAEKVKTWYDNQELISKYYRRFKKQQKTFYLYKNGIYFYKLIGFANVGNEIQLMKLDIEDVMELLNRSTESVFKKLLRKMTA